MSTWQHPGQHYGHQARVLHLACIIKKGFVTTTISTPTIGSLQQGFLILCVVGSALLLACCKCAWDYKVTKCSFFDVTLRGRSVRADKAFQGCLNGAVQRPRAWRAALSHLNQLGRSCQPSRSLPEMLHFTHVPPVIRTRPHPGGVEGGPIATAVHRLPRLPQPAPA